MKKFIQNVIDLRKEHGPFKKRNGEHYAYKRIVFVKNRKRGNTAENDA